MTLSVIGGRGGGGVFVSALPGGRGAGGDNIGLGGRGAPAGGPRGGPANEYQVISCDSNQYLTIKTLFIPGDCANKTRTER